MKENTLIIIKPDAVKEQKIGKIISIMEKNKFSITNVKMKTLSKQEVKVLYHEHHQNPFFNEALDFMTSSPAMILILTGDNIVKKSRLLIGSTNPQNATKGTIRSLYGTNYIKNSIHGSDSIENAKREIALFFE